MTRDEAESARTQISALTGDAGENGSIVPVSAASLAGRMRALQHALGGPARPEAVLARVAGLLGEAERLMNVSAEVRRPEMGADGRPRWREELVPDYTVDTADPRSVSGRVTFPSFYLGSRGAVHGGAIVLLFDEILGQMSLKGGSARTRTAYLKADFRAIAPIERELTFRGWTAREEGRKLFLAGELRADGVLAAEAEALYVILHPWQEAGEG